MSVERADPITRKIADRVADLRKRSGLTQAELAERVAVHRSGWSRSTVVKLERYNRESISVGDVLALALALNVPPIVLVADPRHDSQTPVADDLTVDSWEALLWLTGTGNVKTSNPDLENTASASWLIQAGWWIVEALKDLRSHDRVFDSDDEDQVTRARQRDDDRHRAALKQLRTAVARITAAGAPLPPIIPVDVVNKRALELDVDLPDELREG